MPSLDFIKNEYPLHWLVWNNDYKELDKELSKNVHEKEKHDTRGRTPLMLAVTLGHLESARVLLKHTSNVHAENREGWTVVQEAVSTGDPELLGLVLERRDIQRYTARVGGIPDLLHKLKEAPDFYVEMKWEFASWVPLVSRLCPSDTYRVYKQGSNVRIDTTILGFDQTSWQRGNRSFIFKGQRDKTIMMEVDHEARQVYIEDIILISPDDLQFLHPSEEAVTARLTTPVVSTYVDTDKISFERNKSGIWGWRADKCENINGYDCKVFGANNVAIVTKTRTEHLTESDKMKARPPKSPLQSFLSIAEIEESQTTTNHQNEEYSSVGNPSNITPEEYFDETVDLDGRDIGRPREINTKIQKFKATLWLCEKYPLSLPEQIMPIVDLMAISSTHFAKLKDFIQMQLPAGFPVKIEIPIFHVVNARITFGNIFGLDEEIPGVTRVQEDDRLSCIVDESCFAPPPGYTKLSAEVRRQFSYEEEDELLQFAIQQSLIEAGSERDEVDIWEALRAQRPSRPNTPNLPQIGSAEEERQLQRCQRSCCCKHTMEELHSKDKRRVQEWCKGSSKLEVIGHCDETTNSKVLLLLKVEVNEERKNWSCFMACRLAIQASLALLRSNMVAVSPDAGSSTRASPDGSETTAPDTQAMSDLDLQMALALSQQDIEVEERLKKEEEEMMEQALRLSLKEK